MSMAQVAEAGEVVGSEQGAVDGGTLAVSSMPSPGDRIAAPLPSC